jgi:hypothetical protein
MIKYLLLVFLLVPHWAQADAYMDEYKAKVLLKDEAYKGQTSDLKDEMKNEITSNPLEEARPAPVQAQELPAPEVSATKAAGAPQAPLNMSLQDAAAMGKKLLDQQKANSQQLHRK